MYVDNNQLYQLLNNFGLTLKIENGNAIFTDIETGLPMKSYVVRKDEEFTSDANALLSGCPFYLEGSSKYYKMNIRINSLYDENDKDIRVNGIFRIEEKANNVVEHCSFSGYSDGKFVVEEKTCIKHNDDGRRYEETISDIIFDAREFIANDRRGNGIIVRNGDKRSDICYKTSIETGEVIEDFKEEYFPEMSFQDTVRLVEESKVFKDTLSVLSPVLAENYEKSKNNGTKVL